MTTVYEAIMLAVDHIERNPSAFNFMRFHLPSDHHCGTKGCAIGWIGHFSGMDFEKGAGDISRVHANVCEPALGVGHLEFYNRMNGLAEGWKDSATICAATLRKYAEKYHAPEGSLRALTAVDESFVQLPAFITAQPKRDLIPASVREIFSRTYTARDLTV